MDFYDVKFYLSLPFNWKFSKSTVINKSNNYNVFDKFKCSKFHRLSNRWYCIRPKTVWYFSVYRYILENLIHWCHYLCYLVECNFVMIEYLLAMTYINILIRQLNLKSSIRFNFLISIFTVILKLLLIETFFCNTGLP